MKKAEIWFNLFSIPIDAAAIFASAVFAYFLRIQVSNRWPILFQIDLGDYLRTIVLILPFLLLLFAFYGLYNLRSTDRLGPELLKIVAAVTTALMLVVFVFFFDRDVFPSRLIVLLSWVTTIVFVSIGRVVLRFIRDGQLRRGRGLHKLVAIMGDRTDQRLLDIIAAHPELGYQVTEVFDAKDPALTDKLEQCYKSNKFDELLQADPNMNSGQSAELVRFCHDRGVKFNFVPDIFGVSSTRMEVEMLSDMPVIKLKGTPLDGWGKVVKRIVDVVFSLLALLSLLPIYLIIYLAIKLDSPGPVIYIAPRAGYGHEFPFYKFRTMYTHLSTGQNYGGEKANEFLHDLVVNQSARGNGPLWKIKDDPRITRVGSILRKYKLDELPQFWNVLKGDMSLVGPRAHVLEQVEKYRDVHKRLFTIKPGLTGLTQIAQIYNPTLAFDEEVRFDTYYIENWSLWMDVRIIFKTAWTLLTHRPPKENYG